MEEEEIHIIMLSRGSHTSHFDFLLIILLFPLLRPQNVCICSMHLLICLVFNYRINKCVH